MKRLLPALVALILAALPLRAQDAAVTGVIDDQIEAFLADDLDRAFSFASPMIQGMFRTPETFGQMVRQGYPMVWRPADVRYGSATQDGGRVRQTVIITDRQGAVHALEYEMIPDGDGWRINGVRPLQAPSVGA